MKTAITILLSVTFLCAPAFSAEKMTFAVMELEARGVPESDAEKISHIIRTELSNVSEFQVIDRNKAAAGCGDVACAVQAGKQIGARKVLIGSLMRLGEQMTVTCRVIDVEKGTVDFAGNEKALFQSDELYMAERLCEKVVRKITGKQLYKEKDRLKDSIAVKRYRLSSYSDYHPVKDPTAWLALGSGIACGFGFAIAHDSYVFKTRYSFADSFQQMFLLTFSAFSMNADLIALAMINDYAEKQNRHHRAERLKERNYYISAGVGGFSILMLVTFIGRNIAHTASSGEDVKVGDISFIMPSFYDGPAGGRAGDQYNIGMGLSMKF